MVATSSMPRWKAFGPSWRVGMLENLGARAATPDVSAMDFKQCNALLRSLCTVPFSGWLVIDGHGQPDMLFDLVNPTRVALHARLEEIDPKRGDKVVESAIALGCAQSRRDDDGWGDA
jgi:hypothetical protein